MCLEHVSETAAHVLRDYARVCPKLSERAVSQSTRHTHSRTQVVVKGGDVFLFFMCLLFKHVPCVRFCLNTCVTI